MRRYLLSSVIVLSVGLNADELTLVVSPQSLNGRNLLGTPATGATVGEVSTLPAGAQLVRSFVANALAVNVTSRPVFGQDSADWPVLEIGPDALVFLRQGAEGHLALVLGGKTPQLLPISVKLDSSGQSERTSPRDLLAQRDHAYCYCPGEAFKFTVDASSTSASNL